MSAKKRVDATRLWLVLARCFHAVRQIAERSIADTGLGLSDFAALEALLHKGPLTITEIQAKVLLASGSMTAAVDRLERKGLIVRTFTQRDRRARVLELTAEGKRLVEESFRRHAAALEEGMKVLNNAEKRQAYELLRKLGVFAAGAARKGKMKDDTDSQE